MKREEAPIASTWDLSLLFPSVADYDNQLELLQERVLVFKKDYENQLKTVSQVSNALREYRKIREALSQLGAYTSLAVNANMKDREAQTRYAQAQQVFAKVSAQLSFFNTELSRLDNDILDALSNESENRGTVEKIKADKPHLLSKESEEILAALSNTIDFPYQSYNDTKFKDIKFPPFTVDGQEITMTYNTFDGKYESHTDQEVRRQAFETFSRELKHHENTAASTYNAHVQTEKTLANLRGYASVFDYLLDRQKVSMDLYNRQLDVIMAELAPHMRRYAKLIGKLYGLDQVHYEDLKLDIDPEYSKEVTYEQAKQYVLDGLQALGPDYLSIMQEAFDKRWIDYAQTEGKRTGAFCSSPYGANSFILMFFNGGMSDVMTLAHELGHAGHFQLAHKHQNISDARCSMYFVEAPSTTNELLVENHLMKAAGDDLRMRRWIISKIVGKTYYHNFVTHFLEGYYQREVYRLVDQGQNLDAATLNQIFLDTLKQFWGEDVVLTPGAENTWMRQPHYFMGLYSYTYSAGLTIGTQVAKKIQSQGEDYAKTWIDVLKMGGSKKAQELAQAAGIDLSTDQPLKDTIAYIGSLIDDLEALSEQLA